MKKVKEYFVDYYLIFCVYAFIGWLYEVLWMWFVVPPKHFINRGVLLGPFLPIYGFGMLLLFTVLHSFMKEKHTIQRPLFRILSTVIVITFIYTTIIEYTTPKIYNVGEYLSKYGIGLFIANILGIIIISFLVSKKILTKKIDCTVIFVFIAIWLIATGLEYVSHFVMDKFFNVMLWDYTKDFLNVNKRINWDASRNFAIGGTFLLYTVQPLLNKKLPKIEASKKTIIAGIIGIPMLLDFIFHVILKII